MVKHVVIIASGETERRALPRLLSHMREEGMGSIDIRIPPRGGLTVDRVAQIVRAVWFEAKGRGMAVTKFVVLLDADGKHPDDVRERFQPLQDRVLDLGVQVLTAVAKWHLEAWFFGDAQGLRGFLGRALGSVDASAPDEITNPKQHLKNLLETVR